uniref:Capsule polysaccharide biosynthesis protein n=1 Tax=Candidatus Kentrum sp. DK TaxID=2126562 RepID=A0A450SQ68_9GAMM|nr:MAG: Capsule polysaccharide biosynthesis protein [Candidatus Kentron sp. DK]
MGGFEHFHRIVSGLPERLGPGWQVVYKKHPVEDSVAPIDGAINADDANIYDLVEMADALVVINSGTGLYGMMFEKPVYILGQAWYAHAGLNISVTNPDSLAGQIAEGFAVDRERMLRFVHYLRYRFYSFGTQIQHRVRGEEGSMTAATLEIDYYELRGWTEEPLFFTKGKRPVPFDSPLFDRYRGKGLSTSVKIPDSREPSAIVRAAKRKKLRERPLRFFLDAIRNRVRIR